MPSNYKRNREEEIQSFIDRLNLVQVDLDKFDFLIEHGFQSMDSQQANQKDLVNLLIDGLEKTINETN